MSLNRAVGIALVLSLPPLAAGARLWRTRGGALKPLIPLSRLYAERGLFMAAVLFTAIGLLLLEEHLRGQTGYIFGRIGSNTYLLAAAVVLVAEASGVLSPQKVYSLFVVYAVLALLGQAAVGAALIPSGVVSAAVGRITVVWNLGLLIVLPLISPGDLYYPFLHHMVPLLNGLSLLIRR